LDVERNFNQRTAYDVSGRHSRQHSLFARMVLNGTAHIRLLAQTDGYVDQVDQDGFGVIGERAVGSSC